MRQIKELDITDDYFNVFLKIVGFRQGDSITLEWLKDQIKSQYDYYDSNKNELFGMIPFSFNEDQKQELKSCYDSQSWYNKNLKSDIKKLDDGKCPYCWIDKSRQVEHYLPRTEFPEYSVFINNLIPSCGECNNKKGATWRDDESRTILNVYYDKIPLEQFLYVELSIDSDVITSEFYVNLDGIQIDQNTATILKKHTEKLNLLNRYSESIHFKITEMKFRIIESWGINENDIIISLIEKERDIKWKMYGKNNWEWVLYDGIVRNWDIIKYLMKNEER